MYIVRWLMGHPMIAVWVLGAIAILLSYGSSYKETTDEVSDSSSKVTHAIKQNAHASTDSQNSDSNQVKKPESVEASDNALSNKHKEDKKAAEGIASLEKPTLVDTGKHKTVDSNAETNQKAAVKGTPGPSDDTETDVADLSALGTEELLVMAREAYWNNGLDEAAEIYQQLIKVEPKVVSHRGELGNVYWRQGYPKKAAKLYSEIAIPMIESGDAARVANMVGFIGLFYPDRASVIQDRLDRFEQTGKKE